MKIILAGAGGSLLPKLVGHDATATDKRRVDGHDRQLIGEASEWPALLAGHRFDIAISTLGTTQKSAGSQAAFAAIDRDAVVAFARAAKACGAQQCIAVSSVNAKSGASNFYMRIKGEAEDGLRDCGFDRLDLIRPGLLRGNRQGPPRTLEGIAIVASPLTDLLTPRSLDHYRSVAADDVAKAIAMLVGAAGQGVHIHHNREVWALSGR
jgi:uncharacterized protein YbjT (DUF2867 family)